MAMLRTGEADIANIARDSIKEAKDAGLNIVLKENAAVVFFHPNMQWENPVFGDIRFRKALNLALDRKSIIKHIFGGVATPVAVYPGAAMGAVDPDLLKLKPYPYDPEEAKRLIKEGGWEGYEFTVLSYPRAGCPEYPRLAVTVAGYWEKIGLKVKIRRSEWGVWRNVIRKRKSQNTVHGYESGAAMDPGDIFSRAQEKFYGESIASTLSMPKLNAMFERIEKSKDLDEILKVLADTHRYRYDQYTEVPICEIPHVIATTKRIPKWNPGVRRRDKNLRTLIRQR